MHLPIIAALLLAASPGGDDGFCQALREIVAAAPDGFVSVSNGPLKGGGFEGRIQPDFGVKRPVYCVRFAARDYVPHRGVYYCNAEFAADAPPGQAIKFGLAQRTAACLGVALSDGANSDVYVVQAPGVEISVRSNPNYMIYVFGRHPGGVGPVDSYSLTLDIVAK